MNASTNPPTTAPESEPSPPITLAMKALSTGLKPIVGSTVPRRARMKIAATPASAPEIANAAMITRLAEMPIRRVDLEVLAGREHAEALHRAAQEEREHDQREQTGDRRDHLQPADRVRAAEAEGGVEDVRHRHTLLARRDERQEEVLDDHAEREAREQQRDEARAAQRPERDALHQHGRDRRPRPRRRRPGSRTARRARSRGRSCTPRRSRARRARS